MQIEKKICIPTSRCSSSMSCIGKHFPAGGVGKALHPWLSCNGNLALAVTGAIAKLSNRVSSHRSLYEHSESTSDM